MGRPAKEFDVFCIFEGCIRPAYAKGLCVAHYNQWRRALWDPTQLKPVKYRKRVRDSDICLGPNCDRKPIARQLCRLHYDQWYRRDKDLSKLTEV